MSVQKLPGGTRGTRGAPGWLAKIMMPIMLRIHRRQGDRFQGQDLLYLTTVGAKSGETRTNPVMRFDDGEGDGSSWPPRAVPRTIQAGTTTSWPTPIRSGRRSPGRSTASGWTSSRARPATAPGPWSSPRSRGSGDTPRRRTGSCRCCASPRWSKPSGQAGSALRRPEVGEGVAGGVRVARLEHPPGMTRHPGAPGDRGQDGRSARHRRRPDEARRRTSCRGCCGARSPPRGRGRRGRAGRPSGRTSRCRRGTGRGSHVQVSGRSRRSGSWVRTTVFRARRRRAHGHRSAA